MKTKQINTITKIVAVALIYTAVNMLLGEFVFMTIQFRIGEALMILCLIDRKYIYGLTLGCFITNMVGVLTALNPIGIVDIIFGTFATYLAGELMYRFREVRYKGISWLSDLMPGIVNGIIIGIELTYLFFVGNMFLGFLYNFTSIFISETVIVLIIGELLHGRLKKVVSD
ncbi:MAG: QueT transporter family protein [Erysipelotrichaceae bacterium]|nr:QueT transporter family protein [Erysipelotrichaceae bacterium]